MKKLITSHLILWILLAAECLLMLSPAPALAYDNGAAGVVNEFGGRVYWCIDEAETIGQSVHLRGWAFDTDAKGSSLNMHLYCGTGADNSADPHGGFSTNVMRSDVNSAYGLSGAHGFDITFATKEVGEKRIQLFTFYADGTTAGGSPVPIWDKVMTYKQEYAVTYNANGGSGAPGKQTKVSGVTLKLSTSVPTWIGHTFQGWATSATSAVAYLPGDNYTKNETLKLFAVWELVTYPVTYDANGGEGAPEEQTKKYGEPLILSETFPSRTDYEFKGWGTVAEANAAAYQPGDRYEEDHELTLFAVWEYIRIPGDVNGDHTVDGRDALRLLKYLNGSSVAIVPRNADVNNDGAIDESDAETLLQFLAGAVSQLW